MRPRADIERDIALHEATLADRKNIKSGRHEENVMESLAKCRRELRELKS